MLKDIAGYEGLYAASDDGHIWSYKRNKFLKEATFYGYKTVVLSRNGEQYTRRVNVLVLSAFVPKPSEEYEVGHKDSNRENNSLDNLEWVTHKENCNTNDYRLNASKGYTFQKRRVRCIETGEVFDTLRKAAKEYLVTPQAIGQCCRGVIKTCAQKH